MGKVVKRSLSFPAEVFEAVEEEARLEGVPVSSVMAAAARNWVAIRRGLRAVASQEADMGPLIEAELVAADRELDRALRR